MIKSAKWLSELYKLIYVNEPQSEPGYFVPSLKNLPLFSVADLTSVQPMAGPETDAKIWFKDVDENRPVTGDIVTLGTKDGIKYPPLCHCCAPRWHKIYTGIEGGWVFERDLTEEAWRELVTKLATPLTDEV